MFPRMKIGILTGGGDCPGLNAVIRAAVRKGITAYGDEFVGFRDGWRGPLENDSFPLDFESTRGILPRGGTILGSSRTNPFKRGEDSVAAVVENLGKLDALIAIGGEDTLGVATRLYTEHGVNVVGVPKTIDNDLSATDQTFGFDTAIQIVSEACDRLHTTADSHHRTMLVEVMGRHAGWIALHGGIAGGADIILIPEKPFVLDEIVATLKARQDRGSRASLIVCAEGALPEGGMPEAPTELDEFGHVKLGGIGQWLEGQLSHHTGSEVRLTQLAYIQRGGTPTAFDRVLGTRLGATAIDGIHAGAFGKMAALRGTKTEMVELTEATGELRTVPLGDYDLIAALLG
jgi:ATP-dependent phosphofructokinase / diphosphate-dependent phosphofructokinase